jgi:hypothetical protein
MYTTQTIYEAIIKRMLIFTFHLNFFDIKIFKKNYHRHEGKKLIKFDIRNENEVSANEINFGDLFLFLLRILLFWNFSRINYKRLNFL